LPVPTALATPDFEFWRRVYDFSYEAQAHADLM
jgi:hypothetical protein